MSDTGLLAIYLNEEEESQVRQLIDATFDAAEGGSNDEEIAALQACRDLLAGMIGYGEDGDA